MSAGSPQNGTLGAGGVASPHPPGPHRHCNAAAGVATSAAATSRVRKRGSAIASRYRGRRYTPADVRPAPQRGGGELGLPVHAKGLDAA